MDRGGAETFLMKVYRNIDKNEYQMDFCVYKSKKGFYDDEINEMGGKIYVLPPKSRNPIKSFFGIVKIVKSQKYYSVFRTSQQSLATMDLLAAKIGGAKKLIYRSSNANITGGIFKKIVNRVFSFLPKIIPNVKIAPSTEAAIFVFGKKQVNNGQVIILPNGLDYNRFKFNIDTRNKVRQELKLDDNIIIGHVGRFNVQKNHDYLLDIFNELHLLNDNVRLILIGEGELEKNIKEKINKLGLESTVYLLGSKQDISGYLMAMDYMIFPSFFEGMPNVIIEAQASGLKCILSDTITKEANITGLLTYKSLNDSPYQWAKFILTDLNYKRKNYKKQFSKNGYIISEQIELYIKNFF